MSFLYKCFLIYFVCLLFSSCCFKKKPDLELSVDAYNFGKIKRDTVYKGKVIITNSGNLPLVIEKINPGCGCTVVNISKDTIQAGDTCLMAFSYRTYNKVGKQENYITIVANTDSVLHLLQINAYID